MADKGFLERELRRLTDEGKLIEAGWIGLRLAAIPLDAGPQQLDDTRAAFFAGASHLLYSINSILDPGELETDDDLRRMSLIQDELDRFIKDYEFRHFIRPNGAA